MWHVTSCPVVCARIIAISIVRFRTHHGWSGHVLSKLPLHYTCPGVSHTVVHASVSFNQSLACISNKQLSHHLYTS